ncbi:hypothetical protein [Streptomyces europaeiscabiei]|uniref:hypothetical protein n=1 Tax=Streptomyces europaeiscabiei TaxID=146819 RepID=UPI002E0E7EF4|nr:hypothetical protein OHB30_33415 [Streptomyces europaeiscabiei]
MAGTGASLALSGSGMASLPAGLDLTNVTSDTWMGIGVEVTLPGPGRYQLDAVIRGAITVRASPSNIVIRGRLWDVGAGAVVPSTLTVVDQVFIAPGMPADAVTGQNDNGVIMVDYAAAAPTTIRIEVNRLHAQGSESDSGIHPSTTLRWQKIGWS